MTKCGFCKQRKGKRDCAVSESLTACSECCGTQRRDDLCGDCQYNRRRPIAQRMNSVPRYSPQKMEMDIELASQSNCIEGAICTLDYESNFMLNDSQVLRMLEILAVRKHFHEEPPPDDDAAVNSGVVFLENTIRQVLNDISEPELVKIIGVIYFVAKRRGARDRAYLEVLRQYVGPSMVPGIRCMPNPGSRPLTRDEYLKEKKRLAATLPGKTSDPGVNP